MGKVFGGLCAILGVFTLTLPIPIVVNSFAGFYKNRLWRNEVAQKKRMRIEEQKRRSKRESELALTPESRQALIERSLTDKELAEITRKRRKTEMTVADMIALAQ